MANITRCASCRREFEIPAERNGPEVRCPDCQAMIRANVTSAPSAFRERSAASAPAAADSPNPYVAPVADSLPDVAVRPHQGTTIFIQGIISCGLAVGSLICGPLATVALAVSIATILMGNSYRRRIAEERADPCGYDKTITGMILGMKGAMIAMVAILCYLAGRFW